eukprot:477417-Rhodomonas_salina.1
MAGVRANTSPCPRNQSHKSEISAQFVPGTRQISPRLCFPEGVCRHRTLGQYWTSRSRRRPIAPGGGGTGPPDRGT